jgi:large subunit ribosomal protein L24
MPLHVSNVALWCGKHKGPAKVGFKVEGDTKTRVCRKCGETL